MSKDEMDGWDVKWKLNFIWVLRDLGIITHDEFWEYSLEDWSTKNE